MPATALFDAIKRGDANAVRSLIAGDPSLLTSRNEQGASAVSAAVYNGRSDIARLLRDLGAGIDVFEACTVGDLARVEALVEADPALASAYAPDGFTPVALAAFFGHRQIVRYLISKGADVNAAARNPMKVAALHAAAARKDTEIVRMLLDAGADPDAPQQQGFRPIHASAQSGDTETVKLLVSRGARVLVRTDSAKTAADIAREYKHDALAAWLEREEG